MAPVAHRGFHSLRWVIAALLLLVSVLNYIDRQALSILASTIQKDLHITNAGYAAVVQAFLLFYTLMYLGSGILVDRLGARISETLFILWWSVANLFTSFAAGLWSLGLVRSLLGMAEPGNYTASAKAVAEWFPPREKAIAVGMYSMGGTLGAALAAPLIAFLAIRFGWRSAFIITGAFGLVVAAVWYWIYRRPGVHPWLGDAERSLLEKEGVLGGNGVAGKGRLAQSLRSPGAILILISRMITDPLWYFYLFWFPKYLQDERGFSLSDIGATVWMVFVAADAGCFTGGWISGRLIGRGVAAVRARLMVMAGAALLLAFSFSLPFLPGRIPPLAAASVFAFAHMAWMTNSTTLPIDLFPPAQIGALQGAIGAGSSLGGFVSSGLVGYVVSHWTYAPLFAAMSFLHPAAFCILFAGLPDVSRRNERQANS